MKYIICFGVLFLIIINQHIQESTNTKNNSVNKEEINAKACISNLSDNIVDNEISLVSTGADNANAQVSIKSTGCTPATNTWTGANATENWNDDGNWSLNHVPLACEDVVISSDNVVIESSVQAYAASVLIRSSGTLLIDSLAMLNVDGSSSLANDYGVSLDSGYCTLTNRGEIKIVNTAQVGLFADSGDTIRNEGKLLVSDYNTSSINTIFGISIKGFFSTPSVLYNSGNIHVSSSSNSHNSDGFDIGTACHCLNTDTISITNIKGPASNAMVSSGTFQNFGVILIDSSEAGAIDLINLNEDGHFQNFGQIHCSSTGFIQNSPSGRLTNHSIVSAGTLNNLGVLNYSSTIIDAQFLCNLSQNNPNLNPTDTFKIAGNAGPGVAGGHDVLHFDGDIDLGGICVIKLSNYNPVDTDTFILFTYTGILAGEFDTLALPTSMSDDWMLDYGDSVPGQITLRHVSPCDPVVNLWTGGGDDSTWHDPMNWNQSHVPLACESVTLSGSGTHVIIESGQMANAAHLFMIHDSRLQVQHDAELLIDGSLAGSNKHGIHLSANGNNSITNNGLINIRDAALLGFLLFNFDTLYNDGKIIVENYAAASNQGDGIVSVNSYIVNNDSICIRSKSTVDKSDGLLNQGGTLINNHFLGISNVQGSFLGSKAIFNDGIIYNYGHIHCDSLFEGINHFVNQSVAGKLINHGKIDLIGNDVSMLNHVEAQILNYDTIRVEKLHQEAQFGGYPDIKIGVIIGDLIHDGSTSFPAIDTFTLAGTAGAGSANGHDHVKIHGDLTLDQKCHIKLQGYQPNSNDTFLLISYTGMRSDTFDSLELPPAMEGKWALDYGNFQVGAISLYATECTHPDFEPLMVLYDSLNGENWNNNTGWNAGAAGTNCDPCSGWWGVGCSGGRVVNLFIQNDTNISGQIPSAIGELDRLQLLLMSNNNLTGKLPKTLGQLSNMRDMRFIGNQLSDTIWQNLFQLPRIRIIGLQNNAFTSLEEFSAPPSDSLRTIWLHNNPNLSGPLPPTFGNLPFLGTLYVQGDNFSDCYPTSYYKLCAINTNFHGNTLLPNFSTFCNNDGQGACLDCINMDITITDKPIEDGTFLKVNDQITSTGVVDPATKVIFHADMDIVLEPDFEVKLGGEFSAEIIDCP